MKLIVVRVWNKGIIVALTLVIRKRKNKIVQTMALLLCCEEDKKRSNKSKTHRKPLI